MSGPWARALVAAVARDGAGHDLPVGDLRVEPGRVTGRVAGHDVLLAAEPVPPAIWTAMSRFARGNEKLEEALAGDAQSAQLEHLLVEDWDEPLVPPAARRSCTCGRAEECAHVSALAYAFAEEIDRDPAALLRWRGLGAPDAERAPAAQPRPGGDPWRAGELPPLRPARPLPPGAVLKRLGPSRIRVGSDDLADVLRRAYAVFSREQG